MDKKRNTLTILVGLLTASFTMAEEPAKKPNIVLIMTDDVGWECFGSYGAEDYKTPNLDRLAKEGVQFNHCYSTPICTTSRVMIMTGKYNFRNYTHFGYLNPKEKTFGNMMQEAGYKTAIAGKWQLNGGYNTKDFPDHNDSTRVNKAGFDEYALWQLTKKVAGERFWSPGLEVNGKALTSEDNANLYGPDIMSDFICDFIERNKEEPFFVYYPTVLVHSPFVPTPDSIGDKDRGKGANKTPKDPKARKENFVAMVNYMDKIVGKIVHKLEELGELENTLILFTSDNGTHTLINSQWMGRSIQGGKAGMKDHGTHVPLIAYWKGQALAGQVRKDLVDFSDFYPTLAELAGVELDETDPKDGKSFLPQIKGAEVESRTHALCYYQPYWGGKSKKSIGAYVRTERFKLYEDGRFYDIEKDLEEKNDLAGSLNHELAIESHKLLSKLMKQVPPVPKGSKSSKERPIHPDWPLIK